MLKYIYFILCGVFLLSSLTLALAWSSIRLMRGTPAFIFQSFAVFIIIIAIVHAYNIYQEVLLPKKLIYPYIILTSAHLLYLTYWLLFQYELDGFRLVNLFIPTQESRLGVIRILTAPVNYKLSLSGRGGFFGTLLGMSRAILIFYLPINMHFYSTLLLAVNEWQLSKIISNLIQTLIACSISRFWLMSMTARTCCKIHRNFWYI